MTALLIAVAILALWLIATNVRLFHTVAWSASLASVTNSDTAFATDGVLSTRNNHLLLVDDFNAIALYGTGSNLTRMRFNNAQLLQYGIPHIWPLDTAATPPDIPAVMDLRDNMLDLPTNEEIILESSTSAAGPQQINLIGWLADSSWNRNLSRYIWSGTVRATAVLAAGAAGAWGTETVLAFERDLRNGVYEVFGCEVFLATGVAFRLRFPDQTNVHGKQLRPGGIMQSAVGNDPWLPQRAGMGGLGIWGRFHSLSLPLVAAFGDATGGTAEIRLQVGYVGEDRSLVFRTPGAVAA